MDKSKVHSGRGDNRGLRASNIYAFVPTQVISLCSFTILDSRVKMINFVFPGFWNFKGAHGLLSINGI